MTNSNTKNKDSGTQVDSIRSNRNLVDLKHLWEKQQLNIIYKTISKIIWWVHKSVAVMEIFSSVYWVYKDNNIMYSSKLGNQWKTKTAQ